MSTKTLANHYARLTPEERFRLIVAASDRGDEVERDRLANAGQRVSYRMPDYAPYAHALSELATLVLLELLDQAAKYHDAWERWNDAVDMALNDGKKQVELPEQPTSTTPKKEKRPIENRSLELYLAHGYILRIKAAGWERFCERWGFAPFGLWQYLPGYERLQHELRMIEGTEQEPSPAFGLKDMVSWMNRVRPCGDSEVTEADILTVEKCADALDATFRERVEWWGG